MTLAAGPALLDGVVPGPGLPRDGVHGVFDERGGSLLALVERTGGRWRCRAVFTGGGS